MDVQEIPREGLPLGKESSSAPVSDLANAENIHGVSSPLNPPSDILTYLVGPLGV